MGDITVRTNFHSRPIIDAWELSADERKDFDYLNWQAIENGNDSASFFRYRGTLYDFGEFSRDFGITKGSGLPESLSKWDDYVSESAFSAIVVRYVDDYESVIVGLVLS